MKNYPLTFFNLAKLSNKVFFPTPWKSTIALVLFPLPSSVRILPNPKRSCSTISPIAKPTPMDDLGTEADDGDDAEGCLSGVRTSETGFIVGVGRKMLGFAWAFVVMGE